MGVPECLGGGELKSVKGQEEMPKIPIWSFRIFEGPRRVWEGHRGFEGSWGDNRGETVPEGILGGFCDTSTERVRCRRWGSSSRRGCGGRRAATRAGVPSPSTAAHGHLGATPPATPPGQACHPDTSRPPLGLPWSPQGHCVTSVSPLRYPLCLPCDPLQVPKLSQ